MLDKPMLDEPRTFLSGTMPDVPSLFDVHVTDLKSACKAYWAATDQRKEQAAYHEILLFGGNDGYGRGGWREISARWLRQLACWIEGARTK